MFSGKRVQYEILVLNMETIVSDSKNQVGS